MIDSMRLQQFKNFRDATLPLGPLTVIVGTNASGKSNLRDAFRFVHGMSLDYTLADIVGDKYVEGAIQWRGVRGGPREIAFGRRETFTLETTIPGIARSSTLPRMYRHSLTVEVGNGVRPLRVVRESLYRSNRLVFDSHPQKDAPAQDETHYLMVRLRKMGGQRRRGSTVRFIADQPIISQMSSHARVPKELREYCKRALSQMRSMRFLDLSPELMKLPSIPGQPLGDRGENLSSVLQAIVEDEGKKHAVTEWIRQLTPLDVMDFEFTPDATGRILLTLVERNGQRTSAYSASDGTLRFLAMIAALMGPDAASFYFLEEIDNGIHPTRLALLLQLIEQHTHGGKVQIATTTHSPQLLGMLSKHARNNAVLVYRLEDETEGRVRRIVEIPATRRVLARENWSRLHESGWLENVVAFAEHAETDG